ncbi:MAG: alpha/beta hydrolase [Hyphomonadaceae bacterium]|nr:alpha/beta hydrolase [Hyphomonadaceae bacterium]
MKAFRGIAAAVISLNLLLACSDQGTRSMPARQALTIESDIVYAEGQTTVGSKPLLMDVYQVDEPCERLKPLVVIIHGGAFVRGSKTRSGWDERARDAARRGYVAAAINYRLIPDQPVISDEFVAVRDDLFEAKADLPSNTHSLEIYAGGIAAAIEDTVTALRFLGDSSPQDRCIDMSRIGLWGGSAGAIAAMHVAYGLDDYDIGFPKPDVVIDYWGMMFIDGMMRPSDAPLFILHGSADDRVAVKGAFDLKRQADAVDVDASLYIVDGAAHGYADISLNSEHQAVNGVTLLALTLNFLDAHLKDNAAGPVYETVTIK